MSSVKKQRTSRNSKRAGRVLGRTFFERSVLEVAPDLLSKYLVREYRGKRMAFRITETEAYDGPLDLACHASKGRTARTNVLFGPAGVWYVYLIYGMYDMLNVVTGPRAYPAAVLIRGVEGYDGPGKLTRALGIDRKLNEQPARKASGLWIEDRGETLAKNGILTGPRVGVAYAGKWADKPWRFQIR
jgi:DNA-3-methyladenine glycosylase